MTSILFWWSIIHERGKKSGICSKKWKDYIISQLYSTMKKAHLIPVQIQEDINVLGLAFFWFVYSIFYFLPASVFKWQASTLNYYNLLMCTFQQRRWHKLHFSLLPLPCTSDAPRVQLTKYCSERPSSAVPSWGIQPPSSSHHYLVSFALW